MQVHLLNASIRQAGSTAAEHDGHSVPRNSRNGVSQPPQRLLAESGHTVRRVDLMPPLRPLAPPAQSDSLSTTAHKSHDLRGFHEVEPAGIEPATSCLQSRRSPN